MRVSRGRVRLLVPCVAAAGVMAVTGCEAPGEPAAAPPPAKRSFDLFLGDKLGLVDYAQQKVRNDCLAKAGYPQNRDTMLGQPRNPFSHLVITARTFGPSSEEEARRLGFGIELPAAPPPIASFDANYDKNMSTCEEAAWQQLGKDAQATYDAYFDLGNKLAGPLHHRINEAIPPELTDGLYQCLTGKGYKAKDRNSFLKAPLPQLFGIKVGARDSAESQWQPSRVPGTVQVGPRTPAGQYIPTAEESEFALVWFRCRQQTGLTRFQLEQAGKLQEELVSLHEKTFTELNPKVEVLARQAATLLEKPK